MLKLENPTEAPGTEKSGTGRTALVLCGGGSGGAVEAGLYKALVELGIHIDFVVGSSIGSVNGALVLIYFQTQLLLDETTHARHDALSSSSGFNVDVAIIGIAAEAVASPL